MGALLGVAMAASCGDDGGSTGSGELGYGSFGWRCAGPGDVACAEGRVRGLPTTVALGSEFELSFGLGSSVPVRTGWLQLAGSSRARELSSSPASSVGVVPDCDYDHDLECERSEATARFEAQESGRVSVLGLAEDDTVADFVTLSILPVTSLAVVRACSETSCAPDEHDGDVVTHGDVGDVIQLRVEPYADGELLIGHLDYSWSSLEPGVARITADDGHLVTLELLQTGTAYIEVEGGGRQDTIALQVLLSDDGPQRRPPGGSAGTDGETDPTAGTDTGMETDTGTGSDSGTGTGSGTGGMQ